MQSTILTLQQQLKDTRQQLTQPPQAQGASATATAGPSRTAPSSPSTSSEPGAQTEPGPTPGTSATGKDCGRVTNGPTNGNNSGQR